MPSAPAASPKVTALRNFAECLGVALAYAAVANLSLKLAVVHPNATAVWPASGIALAALLLGGLRLWPGVLLGSFVGSALTALPLWAVALIGIGNTLESVLGAWLVGRLAGGPEPFHRVRDCFLFVALGCALGPVLAGTVGTAVVLATDMRVGTDYATVWLTWWLGDAAGCIVVAPLLLLWLRPSPPAPARPAEGVLIWALVLLLGTVAFGDGFPAYTAVDYLVLPPLIWAVFRLTLRGATAVSLALTALVISSTLRGHGPFGAANANAALLTVQGSLATLQMTTLLVGALLAERRQALADVTSAKDALEVRVRDRTEELLQAVHGLQEQIAARDLAQHELSETQDRLRQFEKMEAVGRLASGVAHDFNNMLTAILIHADQLLKELPADRSEWVHSALEIREAGRRSAAMTAQLLAFSRKQAARQEAVGLAGVVKPMQDMIARLIGSHIRMEVSIPTNLPALRADRGQVEQILMNLAVNARDAMPEGGVVRLEASTAHLTGGSGRPESPRQGDYVCIEFSDTGCGMDAETVRHLFEPFFTTKTQGTGLGLSTVYGIVRQNGGHVEVHSEPGRGTTFRLYFPQALPDEPGDPARPQLPGARGNETILLVEDEAIVRGVVRRVLESVGYTVVEGSDGQEGLELGERFPGTIHLLLTDVIMPRLAGGEMARRLQELRPDLPVVFMSGYSPDALAQHGVDRASTDFLQKPFSPQALALKVRQVLDRARASVDA